MAKRWEQQVVKAGCYNDVTGPYTVKLLARQHAAMVGMVKKAYTHSPNFRGGMVPCEDGEWINVKSLLAALKKQGGKK